eukprot:TRINITY_DN23589_c0_g1_i1.p1 TRINITY_DN23589_c0_g1~~TRINITY_DN23589_c0_g1_i1.p1  ORF type:complete len:195 (+),score=32.48 TRINITY_DN23589_c0_g1_i1:72-656(+)
MPFGVCGGHTTSPGYQATRKVASQGANEEMCVIVDENNKVLRGEPRSVTVSQRLLGRGSYVAVVNSKQELLVSKRSDSKDVYPGHLDTVISGVCMYGEEYEDTAIRELSEELGLLDAAAESIALEQPTIFRWQDEICDVWGCAYIARYDGDLELQTEEVDWARFVPLSEVKTMLTERSFTPVGRHVLEILQLQA